MRIGLTGYGGFIGIILRKELENDGHCVYPIRTDEYKDIPSVDCLIHCARSHKNITGEITREKWINEYITDVILPYEYSEMAIKHTDVKHIIFVSSIYGKSIPTVRHIPENYIMAKAAELHLAKVLAVKYAPDVRVNAIVLGGVKSDRAEALQDEEGFLEGYNNKTLLDRMVDPDEVYPMVKYLVESSKGITGQEFIVDGGYTVRR